MAIKKIKFVTAPTDFTTEGSDTLVLGCGTDGGVYPKTGNGITAGRVGTTAFAALSSPFPGNPRLGGAIVAIAAGADNRVRITRPGGAGTFTIKLQSTNEAGFFATTGLRVWDSDNSTILYDQLTSGGGDSAAPATSVQGNTDGSWGVVDRTDAGVTITTTGADFYVGSNGSTNFTRRLAYIEYEDGAVPLVADDLRFVPGTLPDPIVEGALYTLQVEAIDTTQSNARVTTYSDPTITIGVDIAVPSGYVISSGDVTQPMTSGLAVFPNTVFALAETPVTPLPPGGGGPPPGGGLLRYYMQLRAEERAIEKKVAEVERQVFAESQVPIDEAESLVDAVDAQLSKVRDPNSLRPDLLNKLFNLKT